MKGLRLHIYRAAKNKGFDGTNGGISAGADAVTLVGFRHRHHDGEVQPLPQVSQVFEPTAEEPAVILVPSALPNQYGPHLEPLEAPGDARIIGPMFGGNYAGSSDSRWSALGELFGHGRLDLVAVHDRFETQRQYDANFD